MKKLLKSLSVQPAYGEAKTLEASSVWALESRNVTGVVL